MLLKMERLLILIVIELFLASTGVIATAESISSSSASSSAQSSSTGDSSSADAYSSTYSECDNSEENSLKCYGQNEVSGCDDACSPQTCESIGQRYNCPLKPVNPPCKPVCRCKPGYYRNKIGDCISKPDCLKCTGPHEYFSCGSACDNECYNLSKQNQTSCPIVNIKCNEKCYCEDGYARNSSNICVPYAECPPICDENEIYDECPAPCPPKRCDVDERIIRCKAPPKVGDPECKPGCRCIDNYYRNDNKKCVPKNECPVKCKNNEIFDLCPPICPPQKCGVNSSVIFCPRNPKLGEPGCKPSCRCIEGYYRNDGGDCIPKDQCLTCYGQNEVSGCDVICPPQTCDSIGQRYSCPLQRVNPPCNPVCRCKPGYYRNKIGNCISKANCLKCTGPHEYFSCGSACDNECYNLSKQNQTSCPIINIKCNDKCYCENGYARNSTNICVPYAECPPETEPNCDDST